MSESGLKLIPQRFQNPKGFATYYKYNRSGVGFMRNSVHPWAQGIGNTVPTWNDWGSSQWLLRFVSSNEQDALLSPILSWRNRTSGQRKPLWNTVRFRNFDLCKQKTISEMSVLCRQVGMIHMWGWCLECFEKWLFPGKVSLAGCVYELRKKNLSIGHNDIFL